jgi:hypothetical protein
MNMRCVVCAGTYSRSLRMLDYADQKCSKKYVTALVPSGLCMYRQVERKKLRILSIRGISVCCRIIRLNSHCFSTEHSPTEKHRILNKWKSNLSVI